MDRRSGKHQSDAVKAAQSGENYVLTTGTSSGKRLAYIIPIVDHVLRQGSGKGIQAVTIYPMNALANSQVDELEKFLLYGFDGRPPVTYKRYTGQEKDEERDEIIKNPPDIIQTNYAILELIMTRPRERGLVEAMRGLQYLVLDELHTYRGRQGADVAMLVRRVRANQTATPRVIVEFEGEAGQLIRDIPAGVSLHLIGIETGPTADRLVRFFRCPDIQPLVTAAGEEAVDQKRQQGLLKDLKRLANQGGGATEFGYVAREGLPPNTPWLYNRHHPRYRRQVEDLDHFDQVRPLGELVVEMRFGFRPSDIVGCGMVGGQSGNLYLQSSDRWIMLTEHRFCARLMGS